MTSISEIHIGAGGVPVYQLKITLKWSKPPIWRRVLVRGNMKLDRLHTVIQHAMGWTNSHLHQFTTGSGSSRTCYGTPEEESYGFGSTSLNEKRYTVADIAPAAKSKFIYEYDFGDSWEHIVLVEKILPPNPELTHPVCLAGAIACPPEDCGGINGYYDMLDILADPKHPEHGCMKEWVGDEISEEDAFSVEAVNSLLKRLKA